MRNFYEPGQWNVICDRCGFKKKAKDLRAEWTGLMVCVGCLDSRHPQTLIDIPKDNPSTPWARPESADVFTGPALIITTEDGLYLSTESGSFIYTET